LMYKYTKNIPMPSLSKENYPYNAKITEFFCDFCEIPAFAHNKNAKFCSCLCRHNAYLIRKEIAKCESDVNITEKLHENHVPTFFVKPKPVGTKIIGAHMVQKHFRDIGLKVTLRLIRGIEIGKIHKVNEYEITRLNKKAWLIRQNI
jgi:hypothetical protein